MNQIELKELADRLAVEALRAGCTAVVVSVSVPSQATPHGAVFYTSYAGGLEAYGLSARAVKTLERAVDEDVSVWMPYRAGGGPAPGAPPAEAAAPRHACPAYGIYPCSECGAPSPYRTI